ncbi:elongation factor ts [Nannochloropsis gaditana]|uniref:Elongation factor Ts, mitochondrial n=1 Tax=Nannochloropsis gaditana TaxID=72520 RepID=W7TYW3_9STRA|nr:elongation factor ts [Nannochloropsis gaditana]
MTFWKFTSRLHAAQIILLPEHFGGRVSVSARSYAAAPLALVKELRSASGAPITDCKKALEAEGVDGDIAKAFEWLRKKGQATVMKNNRAANEGLVGIAVEGQAGVIVEVNSETDFVARNADFQAFVKDLAGAILRMPPTVGMDGGPAPSVLADKLDIPRLLGQGAGGRGFPLSQDLKDLVAKIRENISVRRIARLALPPGAKGFVGSYVHNALNPSMGAAAGLVAVQCDKLPSQMPALDSFGKRLAMHVVAAKPRFLSPASVPPSVLEYERELIQAQAAGSQKPPAIVAKMTEGRLRKFLGEISLLEQPHMIEEGNPTVAEVAARLGKEAGCVVDVVGFVRYKCGEVEGLGGEMPAEGLK